MFSVATGWVFCTVTVKLLVVVFWPLPPETLPSSFTVTVMVTVPLFPGIGVKYK